MRNTNRNCMVLPYGKMQINYLMQSTLKQLQGDIKVCDLALALGKIIINSFFYLLSTCRCMDSTNYAVNTHFILFFNKLLQAPKFK